MLKPTPFGWISQYFFGFFFTYGVYLPFWALWFEDQGIGASDIGFLMGVGFATRCVANLVITPRLHKAEHLIPALRYLSMASVLFLAFHLVTGGNFWMLMLATVLFNVCIGPIPPLSDAMANYYAKRQYLDYGRTRLWGSIAFIVGSTVVGYLVAGFGSEIIVPCAIFGMLLALLFSMRVTDPMPVSEEGSEQARPKLMALLKEWPILRFIVLIALIQGSHSAYYSFSSIMWKSAGHAESTIGYLWSLGVVAEIGIFAFSKRLFGGWSLRVLFAIASVGVIVRWGLTAATTDLWALVLIQAMHGITFALAHIAAIQYIQHSEQHKIVALQALYNAIPLGAVIAVLTPLVGFGYENWGANVFWVMASFGLVALFIKIEPQNSNTVDVQKSEPKAQN